MIDPMLNLGLACVATMLAAICALAMLKSRRKTASALKLTTSLERQLDDLATNVRKLREAAETTAQRLAEQGRHITWLESRVRTPPNHFDDVIDDAPAVPKLNMTERRHRITSLAARGQNVESIAAALSMLPGEVELILDLQRASLQAR